MPTLRALFALLLLLPVLAGAKSPVSHEKLWLMKRVGTPVPSPDGRLVALTVAAPAYDDRNQASDIWIVPAGGGADPRRLTFTKGAESGLAWSPDSRRLAFTARREGDDVNQVYVLDIADGGEAARVTSLSTGAAAPRWSPDGTRILFTSSVYPGAAGDEANKKIAAERKALKHNARVYEEFPIRYWDKWLDDRRPHLFVQDAEPGSSARDLLAGSKLAAEPGFAGTETTTGQELVAAWAPDGRSVIFAATTARNTAAYASVKHHLYQVPVAGGEPVRITSGPGSYRQPVFRPDGRALYCFHDPETGRAYNLPHLVMFAWPAPGQPTRIGAAFEFPISEFSFTPDSRTIYLLAEQHGRENLYSVSATGGEVRLVIDLKLGVYGGLAIPGKAPEPVLIANWGSAVDPAEVVRIDPQQKLHRMLTQFASAEADDLDWQPVREFWFTSKAGKKIHSFLTLPPHFDENKKYPLLVLIHGGPHSAWRDQISLRWNYHLLARPGYVVLATNYTGSTGFGEKFAQDIQGDPLRGPGEEINQAADEAVKEFPFIDGNRQAAAGASYGGHLANWLQATTRRYKCLISHAGLVNLESMWGTSDAIYHREVNNGGPVWEQGRIWREQNPVRYARNFRTPILLTVGENDYRVPLNQTLENWSILKRLRIPSRLVVFPDANHWIMKGEDSRYFYTEVHAWLKRYLGCADCGP